MLWKNYVFVLAGLAALISSWGIDTQFGFGLYVGLYVRYTILFIACILTFNQQLIRFYARLTEVQHDVNQIHQKMDKMIPPTDKP